MNEFTATASAPASASRPGASPTASPPNGSPNSPAAVGSPDPSPEWTAVCRLDDIPPLGARRVARPQGAAVAVFRTASDQAFALLDRCPHKGGPLSQGIVFGDRVACPLHNWSIGLADGHAAAPDEGHTPHFALKLEAGVVFLRSEELANLGTDLPLPVAGPALRPGAAGGCGGGCGGAGTQHRAGALPASGAAEPAGHV